MCVCGGEWGGVCTRVHKVKTNKNLFNIVLRPPDELAGFLTTFYAFFLSLTKWVFLKDIAMICIKVYRKRK